MKRILSLIGLIFILIGIICNEWVIAKIFFENGVINSAVDRAIILIFNVVFILTGVSIINRKKIIALPNKRYPKTLIFNFGLSIIVFLLMAGGTVTSYFLDPINKNFSITDFLFVAFGLTTILSGQILYRRYRKIFFFNVGLFLLLCLTTLYLCEFTASFFVPPWPAIGLHGVDPSRLNKSWERVSSSKKKQGFNSWGQRDKERSIKPLPGVYRVAFVGDSFLEESTVTPLSLLVEKKLNKKNVEILNLGVTATSPDEYYYRTKKIAIPMGVKHVYMFFCTLNDFIYHKTLISYYGIFSVYPRDSLFNLLKLTAINNLVINHRRPVLMVVGKAGELFDLEQERWKKISSSTDKEIKSILLDISGVEGEHLMTLSEKLKNIPGFFEILRNPDQGLFRSYFLVPALRLAAGENNKLKIKSKTYAYSYVKETYRYCRKKNIKFTLVIIPEAFQVDRRMQEQWLPLADMQHFFSSIKESSDYLVKLLQKDGIDYIDLHDVLDNHRGTYLNLDGHWSSYGVELVSNVMVESLKDRLNK